MHSLSLLHPRFSLSLPVAVSHPPTLLGALTFRLTLILTLAHTQHSQTLKPRLLTPTYAPTVPPIADIRSVGGLDISFFNPPLSPS